MNSIKLLIGSVDGAAEDAGNQLAEALKSKGHHVDINMNPKLGDLLNLQDTLLLIITSTTGEGELPDNLRPLWRKLYTKKASLSGTRYAVAVLGDSSYEDNFCLGGIELDALLEERGAEKLKSVLTSDIEETIFPEEDIIPWGEKIADEFM